jgi:hypothetical protein
MFAIYSLCFAPAHAQDSDGSSSTILKVESAFVWVPVQISDRNGSPLSDREAANLQLLDNGLIQKIVRIDTEGLPVSLVILMQTGGSAGRFVSSYSNLPGLVRSFVGSVVHEVTLATFDSRVEEIWHFPARADGLDYALTHQRAGGKGAAINDAVAFGVRQLEGEPGRFRRVVLLLSQQRDEGSTITPRELLEQLGASSTVVYSLTVPEGREAEHPLHRSRKKFAVAGMLDEAAHALAIQTANEISYLTGGSSFQFDDRPGFDSAMIEAATDFRRAITLGFQSKCCERGFHRIVVVKPDSARLQVRSRQFYWRSASE